MRSPGLVAGSLAIDNLYPARCHECVPPSSLGCGHHDHGILYWADTCHLTFGLPSGHNLACRLDQRGCPWLSGDYWDLSTDDTPLLAFDRTTEHHYEAMATLAVEIGV